MNRPQSFMTTILFEAALLSTIAVVAGCAVGPKYTRPASTPVQAEYNYASGEWKKATPQANLPKENGGKSSAIPGSIR